MDAVNYSSRKIAIGRTHIHFVVCGKGKPLVLVHGLTNNWEGFIPLAQVLGQRFTLYIPDMPGYGDSGQLTDYSFYTMAYWLHRLIGRLGIRPLSVLGSSMGGIIAAEYALRYPDQSVSAVIMGPVLTDKGRKADLMRYSLEAARHVPGGVRILKKIVETKFHAYALAKYVNMHRFDRDLIDRYGMNGKKKMTAEAYVAMGIDTAKYDMEKTLSRISIPTLLLFGKEDRISSYRRALAHNIPANPYLSLSVIPEAGHIVCLEKSSETAGAIEEFIQKCQV